MREPGVVAGLVLAAGWLAGCSGPGGEAGTADPAATRDLHLIVAPPAQVAQVSDLEAGRSRIQTAARPAGPRRPAGGNDPEEARLEPESRDQSEAPTANRTPPAPESAAVAVPAEIPAETPEPVGMAEAAPAARTDEPPPQIERAPLPPADPVGYAGPHLGDDYGSGGRRGPAVIIRGGRGGVDDDCDLHRPTLRRPGGIAINRVTPAFPSGVLGRSGGPAGMLRGRSR